MSKIDKMAKSPPVKTSALLSQQSHPYTRPVTRSHGADGGVKVEVKPNLRTDNYQRKDHLAEHYNAVIIVEGEDLCVIKEVR